MILGIQIMVWFCDALFLPILCYFFDLQFWETKLMKFKNFVLNFNAAVKNQRQQWLLEKRMPRFFIKGKWKVNVFWYAHHYISKPKKWKTLRMWKLQFMGHDNTKQFKTLQHQPKIIFVFFFVFGFDMLQKLIGYKSLLFNIN